MLTQDFWLGFECHSSVVCAMHVFFDRQVHNSGSAVSAPATIYFRVVLG
jgi:hypothetical protein